MITHFHLRFSQIKPWALALALTSQANAFESSVQGAEDLGPPISIGGDGSWPGELPAAPVPFINPELSTQDLKPLPGAHKDTLLIPEGLTVVGDRKILPHRNTVIYFHGWSPKGEAESFISEHAWQDPKNYPDGFNILLYRWHRHSYDPKLQPVDAEKRVWNHIGIHAVNEYKRLAKSLGSQYSREIRFVGHSLGTQVATYVAYTLRQEHFPLLPSRLDLLDPYFTPGAPLPEDAVLPAGVREQREKQLLVGETMGNMLRSLKWIPKSPAIVIYASMRGFFTDFFGTDRIWERETRGLQDYIVSRKQVFDGLHYQGLGRGWTRNLIVGDGGNALEKFFRDLGQLLFQQHTMIVNYYFESMQRKIDAPRINGVRFIPTAFHARMTTATILELVSARRLAQIEGAETVPMDDDVFEIVHPTACDHRVAGVISFYCLAL